MISSRIDFYVKRAAQRFLTHKCTIMSQGDPVLDDDDNPTYDTWGNQIYESTDSTPEYDVPCLFLWDDVATANPSGEITVHQPTLYVMPDTDVTENDLIQDVKDRSNNTVFSRGTVQSIDNTAEMGSQTVKVLRLSGATTI